MNERSSLMFYTHPMSRGRIVRWMLEEVEAQYETVVMDLGKKITDPEYLSLNPMGKVPTIVHNGTVVTECAAICAYLADVFPDAGLAPSISERGAYYRWLIFGAGCLEAAIVDKALDVAISPDNESMVGYRNLTATLDTFEWQLKQAQYLTGDRFSAADVYVGSQLGWGIEFGTIDGRAAFEEYVKKLNDRPAAKRADGIDNELAAKIRNES